jgi:hypothetical protein
MNIDHESAHRMGCAGDLLCYGKKPEVPPVRIPLIVITRITHRDRSEATPGVVCQLCFFPFFSLRLEGPFSCTL